MINFTAKELADMLHTDLCMLEDGSWQADPHSVQASIETLQQLLEKFGIVAEDTRDNDG